MTHDRWVKVAVHSDKPMAFPVLKDDKFIYFDALKTIEGCTNEIQKNNKLEGKGILYKLKKRKTKTWLAFWILTPPFK